MNADAPLWRRGADPKARPRKQQFPRRQNFATVAPSAQDNVFPQNGFTTSSAGNVPLQTTYDTSEAPSMNTIQQTMALPQKHQYPKAPKDLFNNPFGGQTALHNICARKNVSLQADLEMMARGKNAFICIVHLEIAGLVKDSAQGGGETKKTAKSAAWIHMIARLHASGALRKLVEQPKGPATNGGPPAPSDKAPVKKAQPPPIQLQDLQYWRQNLPFPERQQYPHAPRDLFDPIKIPAAMQQISSKLKMSLSTGIDYFPKRLSGKVTAFSCHLKVELVDVCAEEGYGEGFNKQTARQAAWFQAVSKMHEKGTLKELIEGPDDDKPAADDLLDVRVRPVKLNEQLLQQEKDAKTEIYNYAATYGEVPLFDTQLIQPRRHVPSFRKPMSKSTPNYQVTVTVPTLGLQASAIDSTLKKAETAAAIDFKRKAEQLHASNPDMQAPTSFSVLNTQTAKDFFVFLKDLRPNINIEVETERDEARGNIAQLTWNGEMVGEPVTMSKKDTATSVAHLTAAVMIARAEPELLEQFVARMRKGKGKILLPVSPVDFRLDNETLYTMRTALIEARDAGLPDDRQDLSAMEEEDREGSYRRRKRGLPAHQLDAANEQLKQKLKAFMEDPELDELRQKKATLPMNQYRDEVLRMVAEHRYSIVIGATGSGKTTQVPQIILEDEINAGQGGACNIICTQPRRIAATSVAERVAIERNEKLQDSVGYHVRFAPKLPRPGGSITYCTTGILLEQLKHDPAMLDGVSHILIDEVHERDMNVDFLMIVVKKALQSRRAAGKSEPKVVLMSATLDTELFAEYFAHTESSGKRLPCPSVSVPGRTFPVTEKHLGSILEDLQLSYGARNLNMALQADKLSEDYMKSEMGFSTQASAQNSGYNTPMAEQSGIDWKRERQPAIDLGEMTNAQSEKEESRVPTALLAATIAHVCKTSDEGAILAFVPGLDELQKTERHLKEQRLLGLDFNDPEKFKICLLHSTVPKEEQDAVFQNVPEGCRKIILSTNIAETSVTVTDVRFVLDTGKLREKRYDQMKRITSLQTVWVSRSNAKQRAGRAGRVRDGYYYALYTQERHDALRAVGLPELLRSDLQEVCLSIKAQKFTEPVGAFLAQAIEPPTPQAIEAAVSNLEAIEAFTSDEKLTDLGALLAKLPIHPAWGKMIVLGVIFRCLDPMLILGASQEERSLFISPLQPDARAEARRIRNRYANGDKSDHLAMLNAFREIRTLRDQRGFGSAFDCARSNFIHMGAFRTIEQTARQIVDILAEARLIQQDRFPTRSGDYGPSALNRNSDNTPLIQSLLLAGVYPNLGAKALSKGAPFRTPTERGVLMHVSSLNDDSKLKGNDKLPFGSLFAYSSLAKAVDGNGLFMRDTTEVTPLMTSLFGGRLELTEALRLEMDDWLPFWIKASDRQFATKLVLEFRKALDRVLNGAYRSLGHLDERSQVGFADDPMREQFASQVVRVLTHASGRPYPRQWEQSQSQSQGPGQGQQWGPRWPQSRWPRGGGFGRMDSSGERG